MIAIETTLSRLQNHARTFAAAVEMYGPQIAAALNSTEPLLKGSARPSALADLSFDELRPKSRFLVFHLAGFVGQDRAAYKSQP